MTCICCSYPDAEVGSAVNNDYKACRVCGLIYSIRPAGPVALAGLRDHYRLKDPQLEVSRSKSAFFDQALDRMEAPAGSRRRLLDIGCGSGWFLETARGRGWQTWGVEIVGEAVQQANSRLADGAVFHGRLKEAAYAPGSFDAITLFDVIAVVDDPAGDLQRCFSLLSEGGIIGIRTRNAFFQKWLHHMVRCARALKPGSLQERPDVFNRYCFTPAALRALLRRLGFVDIRITNSRLTRGDPYDAFGCRILVELAKHLVSRVCGGLFIASAGRLILGPSLLVWARRPNAASALAKD